MLIVMQERSTETLHFVKDELLRVCGVMMFNIITDLILAPKRAYGKYIADLEQEKAISCC